MLLEAILSEMKDLFLAIEKHAKNNKVDYEFKSLNRFLCNDILFFVESISNDKKISYHSKKILRVGTFRNKANPFDLCWQNECINEKEKLFIAKNIDIIELFNDKHPFYYINRNLFSELRF